MMDSNTKSLAVAGAALVGLLGVTETVEAQDFGLGTGITFGSAVGGPLVGLEATYWLDDNLAIDLYGSFGLGVPDVGDSVFGLGLGGGILYAIAQGDDTKLELGVRGGVLATISAANDADLFLDVLLRIEHWFDNHFAVNGQVGAGFMGDPDNQGLTPGFTMVFGAQAGIGMMYYFDGPARPGDGGGEMEPEPVRASSPPPASPPPSSGGSEPLPDPESGSAGW